MSAQALPSPDGSLADHSYALDTLEDLLSAPSLAHLGLDENGICDSQGHSIMRIGEQV